jgi:hypothetical protein
MLYEAYIVLQLYFPEPAKSRNAKRINVTAGDVSSTQWPLCSKN